MPTPPGECEYCGRLVPLPRRQSGQNVSSPANLAAESRFAWNCFSPARPTTGQDLEIAQGIEPLELTFPHAPPPIRSNFQTKRSRPPVQRPHRLVRHRSGQSQSQHPIAARQAHALLAVPPDQQYFAAAEKGDPPSRPPRGPEADRTAMFPLEFQSLALRTERTQSARLTAAASDMGNHDRCDVATRRGSAITTEWTASISRWWHSASMSFSTSNGLCMKSLAPAAFNSWKSCRPRPCRKYK